VTSSGRFVRLGTASMLSEPGGPFVNVDLLDLRKSVVALPLGEDELPSSATEQLRPRLGRYAARPALARVLCDYILYHDHNPKKGLELAALATVNNDYQDWWWKARLGKSYYQLGLYRDAEKQFQSSLKNVEMVSTTLELCKVRAPKVRLSSLLALSLASTRSSHSSTTKWRNSIAGVH
jgi:tetratricopeptide repeat protein 8